MEENSIFSKINVTFKQDVIKEALKSQYTNSRTKITEEAVEVINEILKVLVVECAIRSCNEASNENKQTVSLNNLQNVLGSIMLDFP